MIDLSYLTEEEQERILTVLKRDAELKYNEEQRINKLQKTEQDKHKLKYLTGEWFYETKLNRHGDKLHGSDIIRASMTRRKPVTIMELTQIWPGNSSFLKNESKDIFIPPELSGLIGVPSSSAHETRDHHYQAAEHNPSACSRTKPRQNPFNREHLGLESSSNTNGHLQTGITIERISENSDVVPAGHQPEVEYLLPSLKLCQAPQILAEGGNEGSTPIRLAEKKASIRPLSISKSLEDLTTLPSNERWKHEPGSSMVQTVEEASDSLSIAVLDPLQRKSLSVSVPAFIQEQGNDSESVHLSVNSFSTERQRINRSNTNTSASAGLASMSSVSVSAMSIYTDFGHVEVKGTIQFAINYVSKLGELHIFIVQCRNLAVAEPKRNRSDPYVKCYLLPDKAKLGKRKTSVKKKTLNPTYNEILRYKIPLERLKVQTLNLSVWHHDPFGRNSFLGEVKVDLSEWDNNSQMMDCTLKPRMVTPSSPKHVNHSMEKCGDMRISLRFFLQTSQSNKAPQTGEIQVWIKECTNLPCRRGTTDPFVKCSILPDDHQKSRQNTRVIKRTANPLFNHTMVYDGLRLEDLSDICVELTVWDHDRLCNHFIGGTRLGLGTGKSQGTDVMWMDSNSAESSLWRRMIESKNEWVESTIPLRMLIMAR